MKKILRITVCLLAICLLLCSNVYGEEPYLDDNAGLLTEDARASLENQLKNTSEALGFDIVIVTTTDMQGHSARDYADDFYDENGYGYGYDRDGCLLLIHMDENRGYWISTCGYGTIALTDYDISTIGEEIVPYLSSGQYLDAFVTFIDCVQQHVANARSGELSDIHVANAQVSNAPISYTTGPKLHFDMSNLALGLVLGLVSALITVGVLKGQLKTVRRQAAAANYYVEDSLVLTGRYDRFVGRHVNRVRIEHESSHSGGSSVHTSHSGTSHGGGGGRF